MPRTSTNPGLLDLAQVLAFEEQVDIDIGADGRTHFQLHIEVLHRREVDAVDQRVDVLLVRATVGGVGFAGGGSRRSGSAGQELGFQAHASGDQEGGEDQVILLANGGPQDGVAEESLEVGEDRRELGNQTQGADRETLRPGQLTGGGQVGGEARTTSRVLEVAVVRGGVEGRLVVQRLVDRFEFACESS